MFIFGDCHIGSNRRNKWLYKKAIDVWENMVMDIAKDPDNYHSTIVFAGDLWDSDRPTQKDFMVVKNVIDGIVGSYNEYLNMIMIPGNHDRVGLDGICAADMFSDDIPSAGSFTPPNGFIPDENDLTKPAIWNKSEFSRTIRLDD